MSLNDKVRDQRMVHRVIAGAYFDPLTHLFNRRTFIEALDVALQRAIVGRRRLAVVHLDVDGFAKVNQCFGARTGDLVLRELARRLKAAVQRTDVVARGGDDAFLLLLDLDDDPAALSVRTGSVLASLRTPMQVEGHELLLSVSAGAAVFPDDGATAEELILDADVALDASRGLGNGQLVRFDAAYASRLQERLSLSQRLQRAVIEDEFDLVFEPIVDCTTGAVTGAESLLRWLPNDGPAVSPGVFVPLAEENGTIVAIGRWVLRRAFATLAHWRGLGYETFNIGVNVSARQLQEPDFVATVMEAAAAAPIPLDRVVLELTETALLADVEVARRTLDQLIAHGARLAIDDFGTGNATLATLQDLPVSILKIDRRFVANAPNDLRSRQLVGACVGIAENLELITVAEGIETEAELTLVRQLRCNLAQGYLFTPSLSADAFEQRYLEPSPVATMASSGDGDTRGPYSRGRRRADDPSTRQPCPQFGGT